MPERGRNESTNLGIGCASELLGYLRSSGYVSFTHHMVDSPLPQCIEFRWFEKRVPSCRLGKVWLPSLRSTFPICRYRLRPNGVIERGTHGGDVGHNVVILSIGQSGVFLTLARRTHIAPLLERIQQFLTSHETRNGPRPDSRKSIYSKRSLCPLPGKTYPPPSLRGVTVLLESR